MIRRLHKFLDKKQKKKSYLLFCLMFLAAGLEFLSIGLILPIIGVFFNSDSLQIQEIISFLKIYFKDDNLLVKIVILFVSIFLIKTLILVFISWYEQKFIATFKEEFSSKLFHNYLNQNHSFFEERNSSDFIRNLVTELDNAITYILYSFKSILEGLTIIFLVSLLILVDYSNTLKGVLFFFIIILAYLKIIRPQLKKWTKARFESESKRLQFIREGLSSVKDLKLLERSEFIFEKFKNFNTKLRDINKNVGFVNQLPRFILEFILVLVIFYFFVSINPDDKFNEELAILSVFIAAFLRIMPSLNRLINSLQLVKYSSYSVDKLSEEMLEIHNNSINDNQKKKIRVKFKGSIVAEIKKYKYNNKNQFEIKNFFLEIKKNEKIGIIGKSGSGKTTIIEILLGILKPKIGSVKIDDQLIDEISNRNELFGYIPQKVFILNDTIKNNILFGLDPKKISNKKIMDIIGKTNLNNLVGRTANGLEGVISEKGSNLSGGEIQRIGIARAMIYDPPIIFFDEATSSLDTFTERKILKEINNFEDKTFIFVAHRLGTLKETDKIYLIDKGQIVEEGNYNKFINQI